jgi:hypothetical protein
MALPTEIKTREDVVRFFTYLYTVDSLSFHPDDPFWDYDNDRCGYSRIASGEGCYTYEEASLRDRLMREAWAVSNAPRIGFDIYRVGMAVGGALGISPYSEAGPVQWVAKLVAKVTKKPATVSRAS